MREALVGLIIGIFLGFFVGRFVGIIEDLESIESKDLIPMHYKIEVKDGVSDTTFVYDFTANAKYK
jgi:hypothetical protein